MKDLHLLFSVHPIQCSPVVSRLAVVPLAAQIQPPRVYPLDQPDLFCASPALQLLLPRNRLLHILKALDPLPARAETDCDTKNKCRSFTSLRFVQDDNASGEPHVEYYPKSGAENVFESHPCVTRIERYSPAIRPRFVSLVTVVGRTALPRVLGSEHRRPIVDGYAR